MKPILITTFLLVLCPLVAFSQEPTVCISQSAANVCAANSREIVALREKIAVLESALLDKDKSIEEVKETNRLNVVDLTKAMHETEVKLATATGQIIQLEADRVRWVGVIDILIKNSRKKSIGLIAF